MEKLGYLLGADLSTAQVGPVRDSQARLVADVEGVSAPGGTRAGRAGLTN